MTLIKRSIPVQHTLPQIWMSIRTFNSSDVEIYDTSLKKCGKITENELNCAIIIFNFLLKYAGRSFQITGGSTVFLLVLVFLKTNKKRRKIASTRWNKMKSIKEDDNSGLVLCWVFYPTKWRILINLHDTLCNKFTYCCLVCFILLSTFSKRPFEPIP